jgi:beta-fructofuranosidase
MMIIDRRGFIAGAFGTAAVSSLCQGLRVAPVLASAKPSGLARDPRRPQFHLLPAANWMNDPNAPVYFNGRYHLFYQYNPDGAFWGDMHWGHAISTDMVHWKHLPVALAPTAFGPDADGCFTGTAAVLDGKVTILYTGVHAAPPDQATIRDGAQSLRETQCLATSDDSELKTWTKLPAPVIAAPPPELQVNGFRDPSPWRQGDGWYMVLGSGIANRGGAVLLYKSRDLRNWEYMHVLAGRNQNGASTLDAFDPWEVWECPEFFALGDRHVLIYSTSGKVYWQSGVLDPKTMRFHAGQAGILDYGSFYAAKTQLDRSGNRILWGWIPETRALEEYKAAGWAGLMSLPRVLSMGADGRLGIGVAAEVNQLRGRIQALAVTADEDRNRRQIETMSLEGCRGEILCTVQNATEPFELTLSGAADKIAPWLTVQFDPLHAGQVSIDARPLPVAPGANGNLELHLYIDGSVIEVFVDNQIAFTKRFYPAGNGASDLRMKWTGKTTNIARFTVWQLSPISADRLTS